jgi:hypothetical protein
MYATFALYKFCCQQHSKQVFQYFLCYLKLSVPLTWSYLSYHGYYYGQNEFLLHETAWKGAVMRTNMV